MGLGSSTSKVEERDVANYDFKSAIKHAIPSEKDEDVLFLLSKNDNALLEVLLFNPRFSSSCFCLMSFSDKDEALERFVQLADHLAPFIKNIASIYNKDVLNDIIECFKEHPSWTAAHVAAELELTDCFDNEEFMKEMECHLSEEELTPLHLACKDGKDKSIVKLMQKKLALSKDLLGNTPVHYLVENHPELIETVASLGNSITSAGDQFKASLDVLNNYSESPIHVAIRLSQEKVLQLLLDKGADSRMPCGNMYAIHLALKNNSIGCAEVLLRHNEGCIHDKDDKYQATALHWVKSSKMVDVLMKYKAELNDRGAEYETALHVMAKKKRLDCAIALVSNGIDVNAVCNHGKNALHYAVEARDLDMVKALLLFGVDHELKDHNGWTPLEFAQSLPDSVEISDIRNALITFTQIHRGHFRHEELEEKESFTKKQTTDEIDSSSCASILKRKTGKEAVLCMDGGGIRGLVLTELLFGLEEVTGYQTKDLFDWISGTSTGSYLALAIADGKSVEHCQRAYFRMKQTVFQGSRPFPSEPLESFLIDEFGKDRKMNTIAYPRLIIPAIIADRKPAVLHLFRNYDADYDHHFWVRDTRFSRPRKPEEQEIWRSARCSGAAPTYFRAMDRYLDGGLIANNPTLDVLTEIHKYKKYNEKTEFNKDNLSCTSNIIKSVDIKSKGTNDNLGVVISLGTGRAPLEVHQGIDLFKPSSVWETTELLNSARCFGELLVDQVTNSDDHVVERAMSWCEMVGLNYFRMNPALSSDVELDENDDKTLIRMLWDTRLYLKKNKEILKKAGRTLLGLD